MVRFGGFFVLVAIVLRRGDSPRRNTMAIGTKDPSKPNHSFSCGESSGDLRRVFHNIRNALQILPMPAAGAGSYDDDNGAPHDGAPQIIKQSDRPGQPGGAGSNLPWRGNGRRMPINGIPRSQGPQAQSAAQRQRPPATTRNSFISSFGRWRGTSPAAITPRIRHDPIWTGARP